MCSVKSWELGRGGKYRTISLHGEDVHEHAKLSPVGRSDTTTTTTTTTTLTFYIYIRICVCMKVYMCPYVCVYGSVGVFLGDGLVFLFN